MIQYLFSASALGLSALAKHWDREILFHAVSRETQNLEPHHRSTARKTKICELRIMASEPIVKTSGQSFSVGICKVRDEHKKNQLNE